jgi:iron-sulfur cluster assembly protein
MISLTEKAAEKVRTQLENRGKGLGIRVGVKTSGCSGLSYVLEYVDTPNELDDVWESNGVKIFSDPKSLVYIAGLSMDWTRNGLNEGFEFNNPNETARCGCGESFKV